MTNIKSSEFKKMMCKKHSLNYHLCLTQMTNWWYYRWTEPCDNPYITHDRDIMSWLTDEVECLKRSRDFNWLGGCDDIHEQLKFNAIVRLSALKMIIKSICEVGSINSVEYWLSHIDLEESDEEKYLEIENNCEIDFKN
jgi:hypothetical protein